MTFQEYVVNELIEQSNDNELDYDDSSVGLSAELDYTTQE